MRAALCATILLSGCSGGRDAADDTTGIGAGPAQCTGFCQTSNPQRLTVADVQQVIAQASAEASARSAPATIAVVDHVGNVLAVYRMPGAATTVTVSSTETPPPAAIGGLDGLPFIPDTLAVISKALTATYFSAEQNAFSTRTASQIIQEHFNPGELNTPGGPLFSVQISQLPCSDISRQFNGATANAGTHRAGIGFAADPGGLPLYKQGVIVGAIGVIADGLYSLDKDIVEEDADETDELIATAGTFGFAAPRPIRADRITLDGKTLRFADVDFDDLAASPAAAPAFGTLPAGLVAVPGYTTATVLDGTFFGADTSDPLSPAFGTNPSGVRPANAGDGIAAPLAALDGFLVVDDANVNRFPATGEGGGLTAAEVESLLENTLAIANRTRSQVRRPLGSRAGIHVTIVGQTGDVLGMARTRDALVDAIDVTTQKARTALFFSKPGSDAALNAMPDAEYADPAFAPFVTLRTSDIGQYATDYQDFIGRPLDGSIAWSLRALSNISRPHYPDDIDANPRGPLSKPIEEWSIFSTGLQLDLVYNAILRHVAFVVGALGTDVAQGDCTGFDGFSGGFAKLASIPEVRNGITLFAGGLPIYKGGVLVGAIGASGDGLEQDNMVPLLAVDATAKQLGTISNAPKAIRADILSPGGVHLRWAICPQKPFLDSDEEDPCEGI
ncbi:MAG TPA: heme-binding protein [Candidatus Binatia bacterium]|nr:heme-binding protein [Candidatus Binatia bacterium]